MKYNKRRLILSMTDSSIDPWLGTNVTEAVVAGALWYA
jgi:hypothetical protein